MAETCLVSNVSLVSSSGVILPSNSRPSLAIFTRMRRTSSPMYIPLTIFSNLQHSKGQRERSETDTSLVNTFKNRWLKICRYWCFSSSSRSDDFSCSSSINAVLSLKRELFFYSLICVPVTLNMFRIRVTFGGGVHMRHRLNYFCGKHTKSYDF